MPSVEDSTQKLTLQSLCQDHRHWLRGWLIRQLGSPDDADDITQDTFLRIILSPNALSKIRQPKPFLATTAKRIIIDRFRRQKLEQAYLAELALVVDEVDDAHSPEQLHELLEALEQISRMLDRLSEKCRSAFLLHYIQGYTHAQIAEVLGISTRMVYKHLTKALVMCQTLHEDS